MVKAADGRVPVTVGAQTTSARELVELTKLAERAGEKCIQVSSLFYFKYNGEEFVENVSAVSEVAGGDIIVYNTFWTSLGVSMNLVGLDFSCCRPSAVMFAIGFETRCAKCS